MADEVTDSTGLGLSDSEVEDTSLPSFDGPGAHSSHMDEISSLQTPRLPSFPTKDFTQVMEGLNKYTSWTVYPEQLGNCISSTTAILRQHCR